MPKPKSNSLPKLQKQIILNIAEKEPQTAYATMIDIDNTCHPTYNAFKGLEEKNLVKKQKAKEANGKKVEKYWLTHEGIIIALLEGANHEKIANQSRKLYSDEDELNLFIDIVKYIDPEIVAMTYSGVKEKGSIDFMDIINLLFLQVPNEMEIEKAKKLTAVLKKNSEAYELLKGAKNVIIEQLNLIIPD
jgi:DNA-binding PadR family transcriptional regulator